MQKTKIKALRAWLDLLFDHAFEKGAEQETELREWANWKRRLSIILTWGSTPAVYSDEYPCFPSPFWADAITDARNIH